MQIPATIFDVLGAAAYRKRSPLDVFAECYRLGLLPVEGQELIVRAALKIRKPCPYLEAEKCSVYPVRPLACVLFPEQLVVTGALQDLSSQPHFKDYLCLHQGFEVSTQRLQVAKRLNGKLQRELLVSDWYLFGCSPFFLDLRNLQTHVLDKHACSQIEFGGNLDDGEHSSIPLIDGLFREAFAGFHPFDQIEAKMARLARLEVKQKLFDYLEKDKLFRKLARKCHDTERAFKIEGGKLKTTRMCLSFTAWTL